jgi:mono/diheme cytochrome c family protein
MSRRIHQLAGNATVVSDPAEKGEIYAEFLANCAACHTSLGDGPRP